MAWQDSITSLMHDKKWQSAKGLIAKKTVGKTGIGEAMNAVQAAIGKVDDIINHAYPGKPSAEEWWKKVNAEYMKMKDAKTLVAKVKTLAEQCKTKHSKSLSSSAVKFLNEVIQQATKYPQLVDEVYNREKEKMEQTIKKQQSDQPLKK